MTTDKKRNKDDDLSLFRKVVGDVKPLNRNQAETGKPRPAPSARKFEEREASVMQEALRDPLFPEEMEVGDELLYQGDGVQHSTMKKLRRGQYTIQAELDLHGFTVDAARQALIEFLAHCQNDGLRNIRIIHGKGNRSPGKMPVIKNRVSYWLKQRQDVLAFCSARQVDGGTGAIYVLLRKNR